MMFKTSHARSVTEPISRKRVGVSIRRANGSFLPRSPLPMPRRLKIAAFRAQSARLRRICGAKVGTALATRGVESWVTPQEHRPTRVTEGSVEKAALRYGSDRGSGRLRLGL